jgi:hypothetical protein
MVEVKQSRQNYVLWRQGLNVSLPIEIINNTRGGIEVKNWERS